MPSSSPVIVAIEGGFEVIRGNEGRVVRLGDIVTVTAFKADVLIMDLVVLDIATRVDGSSSVTTIHEDMPGFGLARACLERLPGFLPDWWDALLLPAFATNRRLLFQGPAAMSTQILHLTLSWGRFHPMRLFLIALDAPAPRSGLPGRRSGKGHDGHDRGHEPARSPDP